MADEVADAAEERIEITYSMDDLTFGELADIEKATATPWWELTKQLTIRAPSAPVMAALVWVYLRRKDPGFTLEAAQAMKTAVVSWPLPEGYKSIADMIAEAQAKESGNGRGKGRRRSSGALKSAGSPPS
jgi:hypothetical protein